MGRQVIPQPNTRTASCDRLFQKDINGYLSAVAFGESLDDVHDGSLSMTETGQVMTCSS